MDFLSSYLETEIFLPHQIDWDEANYLAAQLEAARLALESFITGRIDFDTYIDILEMCEVDIDDYLLNVESNLCAPGLLV